MYMYTCSAPRAASPDVDRRDGRTAPRGRRAGNAPLALVNNAKVMQRTVTTTTTRTAATGSTTTTTTTTTTATTTTSASTLGCTMTWASAKAHCESLGRRLCRASEILDASGKFIFGPMAGDHWTPVLDAENEWVQIGEWEKSGHGRHGMAHNSLTNGTKGACGYAAPAWGLSDDPAQEHAHVKHTVYHVPRN